MIDSSLDAVNPRHLPKSAPCGPFKIGFLFLKRRGDIHRIWAPFDGYISDDFRSGTQIWSLASLSGPGPA